MSSLEHKPLCCAIRDEDEDSCCCRDINYDDHLELIEDEP